MFYIPEERKERREIQTKLRTKIDVTNRDCQQYAGSLCKSKAEAFLTRRRNAHQSSCFLRLSDHKQSLCPLFASPVTETSVLSAGGLICNA